MEEFAGIYMATGTLAGDTLCAYKKDGTAIFFADCYGMLMAANSGTYRIEEDRVIATVIPLIRPNGEINEIVGIIEGEGDAIRIFHDNSGTRADSYYEYLISRDLSFFDDFDFTKLNGETETDKINIGKSGEFYLGEGGQLTGELASFISGCISQNKSDIAEKSKQAKAELKARTASEPALAGEVVNVFGSGPVTTGTTASCSGSSDETVGAEKTGGGGANEESGAITENQVKSGAVAAAGIITSLLGRRLGKSGSGSIDFTVNYPYGFGMELSTFIKEKDAYQDIRLFFVTENAKVSRIMIVGRNTEKSDYDDWTDIFRKLKEAVGRIDYFCFLNGSGPRFPAAELFAETVPNVNFCPNIGEIPYDAPLKIESINACQDAFNGIKMHLIRNETVADCLESLAEQFEELAPGCEIFEL